MALLHMRTNVRDKHKLTLDQKLEKRFLKTFFSLANSDVGIKSTRQRSIDASSGIAFIAAERKELVSFDERSVLNATTQRSSVVEYVNGFNLLMAAILP